MKQRACTLLISIMLFCSTYIGFFPDFVGGMNDEHNLSGLIWLSDGTTPPSQSGFAIWVDHGGLLTRYPATGWYLTSDVVAGQIWYSMVLPDEEYQVTWEDTDLYYVEVDGTPWGEYSGNATSNGTGSAGDPFPPYDPFDQASYVNSINYAVGGGEMNAQQWDVRTTAPLDIVPTNISANGMIPIDHPGGMPIGPGVNVTIKFNVTNFGNIGTGILFDTSVWNCADTGATIDLIWNSSIGPLNEYGNTSGLGYDTGEIIVYWIAPSSPGDYYINITVDSRYELPEYDEDNNTVILFFKIGPDLEPFNVLVESTTPSDPIYVGPGEIMMINANARNIGYSSTGVPTVMALYNITGPNGPIVPDSDEGRILPVLNAGDISTQQTWFWMAPWACGDYYVNISVDFNNDTWEANEANNDYTIHFYVGPDLVPNNLTSDGLLVSGYVTLTPNQLITIGVNASNIGPTSTGIYSFRITFTNCTATGDPIDTPFNISVYIGPVDVGGFSQDVYAIWIMPLNVSIFNYYINITIDFQNDVSEESESNNYYILNVKLDAPDLTFDVISLEVAGSNITTYFDPDALIPPFVSDVIEVPIGEDSIIWVTIINVGGVNMTRVTNVTFYNISGLGQPANATPFWEVAVPQLEAGESVLLFGLWPNPMGNGTYYINVSIDYNGTLDINGRILELNEYNNTFTLIINVTPIPITRINPGIPIYPTDATWLYIKGTTELNFTVDGQNPPYITYYRILNINTGSYVTGWVNYTDPVVGGNFTIVWGEGTYQIEFNSSDSVGGKESTKHRIVIVDDSVPITSLIVGDPQFRKITIDILNITSQTPLDFFTQDTPLGESPTGVGIMNASGINGIPESGIFYWIQNLDNGTYMTGWMEYFSGTPFYLAGIPGWTDGNYRIWFNSTDNLGHMETTQNIDIYLDNTGPETTISVGNPRYPHPIADWCVKSIAPFILNAYEALGSQANISTIQYLIIYEGTISSGWRVGTTFDIATDFSQGDGNYSIQFRGRDHLGNLGPTRILYIYVDDNPPITYLSVGEPKYRNDTINHIWNITSTAQLTLAASDDPGIGLNYTTYRIYNATFDTGWIQYTTFFSLPLTWGDGLYNIEYYSIDFIGNIETTNLEAIYLDNTPPTTNISINFPKYRKNQVSDIWNITSITQLNLTFDDSVGCGVNFTQYRIYNSTYDSGWSIYTENFTLSFLLNDGRYNVEYYSMDFLGNTEQAKNISINLDNSPPEIMFEVSTPKYRTNDVTDIWNITSLTSLNLTTSDRTGCGVNHTEYRISRLNYDSGWITYDGDFTLPSLLSDGIYIVNCRSTDYLGNENTQGYNLNLDNNGPDSIVEGDPWILISTTLLRYEINISTIFIMTADDHLGSGVHYIEYKLESYMTWTRYSSGMNYTDLFPGLNEDQKKGNQTIMVRSVDNLGNVGPETVLNIFIEDDIIPPLPPVLKIYKNGDRILLEWDYPNNKPEDIAYYKIYRSPNINGFNFRSEWVNTETGDDNGQIPLRTTWNYTLAKDDPSELYYVITAVDHKDNEGYTSNIVGKVTITFDKGYNTFALPLDPFEDMTASQMIGNSIFIDDSDTVYRFDINSQQWIGHAKTCPSTIDDFALAFGEGYMVYIAEDSVSYTFTGAAGTAIRFIGGVAGSGDGDSQFRDHLTAVHNNGDIVLSWHPVISASGYNIYMGIERFGTGSLNDFNLEKVNTGPVTATTYTLSMGAETEMYFLVVALDAGGLEGASTYAVGVRKITYSAGYSLVSLELDPKPQKGAGFFATRMFDDESGTLFYYDKENGEWTGHPRDLPENINNVLVNTGLAYIVYVDAGDVSYVYTGV